MERIRLEGAISANADDASIWRWFSYLLEERRIRWRFQFNNWQVSVDRVRVAREATFDHAIRVAKAVAEERGVGLLHVDESLCVRSRAPRAQSMLRNRSARTGHLSAADRKALANFD